MPAAHTQQKSTQVPPTTHKIEHILNLMSTVLIM